MMSPGEIWQVVSPPMLIKQGETHAYPLLEIKAFRQRGSSDAKLVPRSAVFMCLGRCGLEYWNDTGMEAMWVWMFTPHNTTRLQVTSGKWFLLVPVGRFNDTYFRKLV